MKNKIIFIGSLCLVLVLGLVFAGCTQTVEFATLDSPKNVKATYSSRDGQLTVTWDAVSEAIEYHIVTSQKGKKTYQFTGYSGYPIVGRGGAIPDLDKWEDVIEEDDLPEGTFTVGVIAYSGRYDINHSKPKWAAGTFNK